MSCSKTGASASGFTAGSPWTAPRGTVCGQSWSLPLGPQLQDKHTACLHRKPGVPRPLPAHVWAAFPEPPLPLSGCPSLWDQEGKIPGHQSQAIKITPIGSELPKLVEKSRDADVINKIKPFFRMYLRCMLQPNFPLDSRSIHFQ